MYCPRCREAFEMTHRGLFDDILVHCCTGCGLLWMRASSLDRLDDNVSVKASELKWEESSDLGSMQCPVCVGTYRTSAPELIGIALPLPPERVSLSAYRCSTCSSFLIDEETLGKVRDHVVGISSKAR